MTDLPFINRAEAARQLAAALGRYRDRRPLVLAIPRGGVPIGRGVADALHGDLDVVLVRKIGAPFHREMAIGAVDEQGMVTLNRHARVLGASETYIEEEGQRQLALIRERRRHYRPGKPPVPIAGRTVIVVDDGLATGATMLSALGAVRSQSPAWLVCAVPVGASDSIDRVARVADDMVCLETPSPFYAVGMFYRDFSEVDDDEVVAILGENAPAASRHVTDRAVHIPAASVTLEGDLHVPEHPCGLVIFAHGSGSSRFSVRNREVAEALQRHGMATLLLDLLTTSEDAHPGARFDIALLARRLAAALAWARAEPALEALPIGLFGASTGAAAALIVAADHPDQVQALVSRGGRPDLAGNDSLAQVHAPTLLVVGGDDHAVLALNRAAAATIGPAAELVIVPGATHLFEEVGALAKVGQLAADWFERHFEGLPAPARHGRVPSQHPHPR